MFISTQSRSIRCKLIKFVVDKTTILQTDIKKRMSFKNTAQSVACLFAMTCSAYSGGLGTDTPYTVMAPLKSPKFLSSQKFIEHTNGEAWRFFSKLHPGGMLFVDAQTHLIHLHDHDDHCLVGTVVSKSSKQFFIDWEDGTRELFEAVILSGNRLRILLIDQHTNAQLDYIQTSKRPHSKQKLCRHAEQIG
ncbi:hypothetical protein [Tateyamaria sp.]